MTEVAERLVRLNASYFLVCAAADAFGYAVGALLYEMHRLDEKRRAG